jgi:hypothetical protein
MRMASSILPGTEAVTTSLAIAAGLLRPIRVAGPGFRVDPLADGRHLGVRFLGDEANRERDDTWRRPRSTRSRRTPTPIMIKPGSTRLPVGESGHRVRQTNSTSPDALSCRAACVPRSCRVQDVRGSRVRAHDALRPALVLERRYG